MVFFIYAISGTTICLGRIFGYKKKKAGHIPTALTVIYIAFFLTQTWRIEHAIEDVGLVWFMICVFGPYWTSFDILLNLMRGLPWWYYSKQGQIVNDELNQLGLKGLRRLLMAITICLRNDIALLDYLFGAWNFYLKALFLFLSFCIIHNYYNI